MSRYFVETPIIGDAARLEGAEAHHAANVMRVRAGDAVTLFDGSGAEFLARVVKVGRSEIQLTVETRTEVDRELRRDVALCCALPRGDRQRWLIEKVVELGVRTFIPLRTKRGVVQPDAGVCERLRRTVIEASKQCGRNRLMQIGDPADVATAARSIDPATLRLLASPTAPFALGSAEFQTAAAATPGGLAGPLAAMIGPEGGLTDDEESTAVAAGWQAVSLGARILRIETAAALVCAWGTLETD